MFVHKLLVRPKHSAILRSFSQTVAFTKDSFNVTRGQFNKVEKQHIDYFKQILGHERVITDAADVEAYNIDWWRHVRGVSSTVLKPKSSQEVSNILKFCNENKLAVCTQGGHTGVVGGGTPVFDEIVLSTQLMNQILQLDETSGTIICEAGCILENVDTFLATKNLIFPLDLGAKGSCHIGGNIATNAGGLRLLRFGSLHGNVLGLEVVLANGEILDCCTTLKKDNTGLHLKNIFIGSEGSLGVITKVAIQCPSRPTSINVAFLGLESYEKVQQTLRNARQQLNEILSAFEVMDTISVQVADQFLNLKSPIGCEYPYYVVLETMGSNNEHDQEKVENFLQNCLKDQLILDGTTTNEPSKMKSIWGIRERVPDAFTKDGYTFLYDFTLPLENFYRLVEIMREHMGDLAHRVYGFGHLGDGNIHLQIAVKEFTKEIHHHIEPYIFEKVNELNGSISAEHGIGFLKAQYLPLVKSESAIRIMKNFKQILDPNGILNPYKTIV